MFQFRRGEAIHAKLFAKSLRPPFVLSLTGGAEPTLLVAERASSRVTPINLANFSARIIFSTIIDYSFAAYKFIIFSLKLCESTLERSGKVRF